MARQLYEEKSSRDMASSSAGGFCYSDVSSGNPTIQTHMVNQIQGFESDPEMFNLTTGIEMIGFNSKNLQQQQSDQSNAVMWKSFFGKPGQHPGASSSKSMMNESCSNFYPHQQHEYDNNKPDFTSGISDTSSENLMVVAHDSVSGPWQENRSLVVDDSSLRCVFPCEGNERPSQGLSLSLSSTNPSSIGLLPFELRQTQPDFASSSSREGFYGKSSNPYQGHHFLLKNSKYLVPAQDLLSEFCSLGTKQSVVILKQKSHKNKQQWEEDNGSGSSKKHSIGSLEFVELQRRKTKLLSMLEEVDRRYRHYCNQMKAVVSSFEAVAGNGAATVYSALALTAMSRHFRSLKDGILEQIQATRKAMGEKETVAPGTTRGETPTLRVIDQALRQQKAFQQMNMMETHPWRPQRGLPERSVSVLRAWLFEHFLHPYPNDVDKHILARQTGLSRSQVSNWFINARVRLWKPMVEEMYLEEAKEHENNMASSEGAGTDHGDDDISRNVQNPPQQDQKPALHRIDSECVSSIINKPSHHKNDRPKTSQAFHNHLNVPQEQCLGRVTGSFGSVELDFSTYTHHSSGMVSYPSNDQSFNGGGGGGGGVSLTLGLQQHGQGGSRVSLGLPPETQSSLFYQSTRDDQIEECQPVVQYSLLDGEAQNLPYRNLMGAQLLHDLAG